MKNLPLILVIIFIGLAVTVGPSLLKFGQSKSDIVGDVLNVDQVKNECKTKINNLTAKMEQFRNTYSNYGLRITELTANAQGSTDAVKQINTSALQLIWNQNQNPNTPVEKTVQDQNTAYNTLVTTLPKLQQQFQSADTQLFREVSQEIRSGRNRLEQTANELISQKTDFKNYIQQKTKYLPNDGGSQLINIYQYNGCIPTARGTNSVDDAYAWIDSKFFSPTSSAATEAFDTKIDKPVLEKK